MYKSLSLILALAAAVVVGQNNAPLQPITTVNSAVPIGCSNCIFVADVVQVIFAEYTTTAIASAIVSEGQGRNGSIVRTTVFQPGRFSFTRNGGLISENPVTGSYVALTGTLYSLGGVTLTSPTAYNVFQSYTLYSLSVSGGSCTTSLQLVSAVATAVSFPIVNGAPPTAIFDAQAAFASQVPTLTCSPGGVVQTTIVPVPTTVSTTTSTTTAALTPIPIPVFSESVSSTSSRISTSTSSSSSSSASTSTSISTRIITVSSSRPVSTSVNASTTSVYTFPGSPIVTQSIITGAAGIVHQPIYFSTALVAGLLVLPAMAAYML